MLFLKIVLICLQLHLFKEFAANCFEIPKYLLPKTSARVQEEAVHDLIRRSIGDNLAENFSVFVDTSLNYRTFTLNKFENKILIRGSDGVSASKGFHYYMKYYLKKDISWTNTHIELPLNTQLPNVTETSTSASSFIYYQNVCTWSYTFAWWGWKTWRKHIDWMAMMGISLTIAPIQEEIWYRIYEELGLTQNEINEHFAGVAFQSWQRMGNIRGWAGPLPATYRQMQMLLQQKILKMQRDLGMLVALPAFAGHVPVALQRLYPNATYTPVQRWNNFPDKYCCPLFLEPSNPLFQKIGNTFLQRAITVYGTNHIYFSDPFNEIQPKIASAEYLNRSAFHIFEAMRTVDANSIWLLQGWMFVKNDFWVDALVKSFLTAVPLGRMFVLDLQSEQFPQYERTHSYYGQPFIWCMLHNFGGTLGMFGSANTINTQIGATRTMPNSSMIGVGITPEGINQNYVMYSLCLERGWTSENFNLDNWFAYFAQIRYGTNDEKLERSWILLEKSVYSYYGKKKMRGKYTVTRRPAMNLSPWTWYNDSLLYDAWGLLLDGNTSVSKNTQNYKWYEHDVVDITRQFLQLTADRLYINLISSYKKRQIDRFKYISRHIIKIFDDMELILATNEMFLLGVWLESAKKLAKTEAQTVLYEINARNQITSWGPSGQILDYATKQWSGIVKDYYQPRWELFLEIAQANLLNNTPFDSNAFKRQVSRQIELPFSYKNNLYPVTETGDSLEASRNIYNSWTSTLNSKQFLHMIRRTVRRIGGTQ